MGRPVAAFTRRTREGMGVVPPISRLAHSSRRVAPPSLAARAESRLSTQASSTKSAAMAHSFKVTSSTVSTGSGRMGSGPRSANTMSGKLLWVQLLEMGTSAPVAR